MKELSIDTRHKIGAYFTRSEFACKCGKCEFDTVDQTLVNILEVLRFQLDAPIIITSGCRCPEYNKKVGGSPKSMHLLGQAADISCPDVSTETLHKMCTDLLEHWGGVGFYPNQSFVHIDVRKTKARWKM